AAYDEQVAAEKLVLKAHAEAQSRLREAQNLIEEERAALHLEHGRLKEHYEAEARKNISAAEQMVAITMRELEPLRKFGNLHSAEAETHRLLADAIKLATDLKEDAHD